MVKRIYHKSLLKKGGCRVVAFAAPGMYYEKVYLILVCLLSVMEPHFAGFFHVFCLSGVTSDYRIVVSKLCQWTRIEEKKIRLIVIASFSFHL